MTMRFQKGIGCPYSLRVPRGPGRGRYRMSRAAYQARVRNLAAWQRQRTYDETRRIEIEIALATHRGEPFRAIAKRLGLRSYAYCWRVARKYRSGGLRMLPLGEQELVAFRDSLEAPPVPISAPLKVVPQVQIQQWSYDPATHGRGCPCRACYAKAVIEAALSRAAEDERR